MGRSKAHTGWRRLYELALHEQDPAKVLDACEVARRAINDRLLASVRDGASPTERRKLENALRQLVIHQKKAGSS